jgi:hypothetical protein
MFTGPQIDQLLKGINPSRVLRDGKGHSHVSQQDITAHLIRVFGFGNFDTHLTDLEMVFERQHVDKKTGEIVLDRYDVCYRATMRLTVRDTRSGERCMYEDGSTATAQNQTLGDAHDLAMKSAISLAKKRCAINLGDQFGLSLYNKGQTSTLVMGTLIRPVDEDTEDAPDDIQDGVEEQLVLGHDEIDRPMDGAPNPPRTPRDPGSTS